MYGAEMSDTKDVEDDDDDDDDDDDQEPNLYFFKISTDRLDDNHFLSVKNTTYPVKKDFFANIIDVLRFLALKI